MWIFFQNYNTQLSISTEDRLEATVWQALEIFETLPQNDGSFMGLINEKKQCLHFSKYNKYLWLIELTQEEGKMQGFFTFHRCQQVIVALFDGLPFEKLNGLSFEKNT